jgi:hypothetical protein
MRVEGESSGGMGWGFRRWVGANVLEVVARQAEQGQNVFTIFGRMVAKEIQHDLRTSLSIALIITAMLRAYSPER